jgi:hypothetical protein
VFESIFDDGSTLTFDSAGNVVSHTDAAGNGVAVPPAGGSPIVQQFADLFQYGIRAAIDSRLTGAQAATRAPGTPVLSNELQLRGLLVIAVLGFVAFKFLK